MPLRVVEQRSIAMTFQLPRAVFAAPRAPLALDPRGFLRLAGLALAGWALISNPVQAGALLPAAAKPAEPDFTSMTFEDLGAVRVPLVYAASKREQTLADAPSSVSIVTAEDIQQYGYRTLGDVLNSLRGFDVTGNRGYNFLGVRGINRPGDYGGRNLLMVDGHRVNEPIFDTAAFGRDFILDVDLIDRVEVVRGPGSTLYGNNAFLSVVNVIPKRGRDYKWGEVTVGGGNFDTYQGRFTVGKQLTNGLDFIFSGTYFDTRGERRIRFQSADPDNPFPNGGVAENLDYERAHSFFAQVRSGDFTVAGAYSSREKGVPHASYGAVFNNRTYQTIDDPSYLDLKYERRFGPDWTILARVGYNRYVYDSLSSYDYDATGNPTNYTLNYDWARSQSVAGEVQVGRTLWERHVVTAGAEFRDLFYNRYQNEDLEPSEIYTSIKSSQQTWGMFVNAELRLYRTNLTLHAGARYDGFSEYDPSFNPRAALIGRPWAPTTLKLLYGEAYRTPNVYETAYNSTLGVAAGHPPTPEKIRTIELVWEQNLGAHFRSSVNAYWNQITDLITRELETVSGLPHLVNRGEAKGRGVEFEIEGRAQSGLRGRLSYALQDARDAVADRHLGNSPRHLAKANLAVPIYPDKLFAGLELHYHASVRSVYDTKVGDFWLMNATLFSQRVVKGLEFTASVQNLFDQDYAFPGGPEHSQAEIPQLGRSVWFKLTYKF